MKTKTIILTTLVALLAAPSGAQTLVAHFDMSLNNGNITEEVTQQTYHVNSQLPACTAEAPGGQALRFDGYSNYVVASLPATLSTEALTVTVTLAAETYPMMQVDVAETQPTYATICGNLSDDGKKGFALQLSSQGDLKAVVGIDYGGGYRREIEGSEKLVRGQWNQLTLSYDKVGNAATLFLNGHSIGSTKVNRMSLLPGTSEFYIGKAAEDKKEGPFLINTFCGLIDDISISNEVADYTLINPVDFSHLPAPDFNYPSERYTQSLWRPQFHGMPSGGWTNESHGLTYSDGRWHVFFQKNANGPYMSRLHWGHISSENLYHWTEEPIAVYPAESFDIKGCWSGCVYEDGGTHYILYTAVDNAKARIVQAKADDETLKHWGEKKVVVDGRPNGLSDDFRDPYHFTANGNQYIIVGTGKNGIGACTLHQYKNGTWTNDGTIFYQGTSAQQHGTFWEMPNVTPLDNGKWLFTCTPLGMGTGVRTICWVGTIGTDGKFLPDDTGVQTLEMGGISKDGFGLLSPSIYQKDGKTLLLGIVPDKLPTMENYQMGWAHNYSLPRELSLDESGQLVQRPYSGLTAMRTANSVTVEETLTGAKPLVSGRQIELCGEFAATTGSCGFRFLKNASLTYNADNRRLTLDLTELSRTSNDHGVYNGIYEVTLTEALNKLHVFLDGSIADIFVNDRWAYSVRLFPTDATQLEAEVFATAATAVKVSAWTLDATQSASTGIAPTLSDKASCGRCYDLQGRPVQQPGKGIYIRDGRKSINR